MIEITMQDINNSQFTIALEKLSRAKWVSGVPMREMVNIGKIQNKVHEHLMLGRKRYGQLLQSLAEVDEHGKPKLDANGQFTIPKEKQGEIDKYMESMLKEVVSFPGKKINAQIVEQLGGCELSAQEFVALDPIMFYLETIDGNDEASKEEAPVTSTEPPVLA